MLSSKSLIVSLCDERQSASVACAASDWDRALGHGRTIHVQQSTLPLERLEEQLFRLRYFSDQTIRSDTIRLCVSLIELESL